LGPTSVAFVAVGLDTSTAKSIVYSYDGYTWRTAAASPPSAMFFSTTSGGANDVVYAQSINRWVAVGWGPCDWMYSNDGKTFFGSGTGGSCLAAAGNCDPFFMGVYGIAWSVKESIFVGVGMYNTNSIVTSTDGITCTGRTSATGTATVYSIAYSPTQSRWIAGGASSGGISLQTSTNGGVTWTGLAGTGSLQTPVYGIAWSETTQIWVAVGAGSNDFLTSTTGTTFTAVSGGNGGNIFSRGAGVWYGGFPGWVVAGKTGGSSGNTIGYSNDGTTFAIQEPNPITDLATGVVYSVEKQIWVAVGNGGIAASLDGLDWAFTFSTLINPFVSSGDSSIGTQPTFAGVAAAYCNTTAIL
jgi:hypothetical protein